MNRYVKVYEDRVDISVDNQSFTIYRMDEEIGEDSRLWWADMISRALNKIEERAKAEAIKEHTTNKDKDNE